MAGPSRVLLLLGAAAFVRPSTSSVTNPAGNGYRSPTWRLPKWRPTYDMRSSTIIMPCNNSGYHSVDEARRYGLVSYDWSNAKQLWANARPMDAQERLVRQVEMVAGSTDGGPRLGVYRNAIKALNWFTDVREKLDDPRYAAWFVKFKDYKGPESNGSYSPGVPACTFSKCSGFYHDQKQTPEHPHGDGSCVEECDCGEAPCGEYVFDHRNASFAEWFVNEHIISKTTILHPSITELYLDDRLETWGVSEEDGHFVQDTGSSPQVMKDMRSAFVANMERLYDRIVEVGGFAWQMFGAGPAIMPAYFPNGTVNPQHTVKPDLCARTLREQYCSESSVADQRALIYTGNASPDNATVAAEQYLAVFLLTRGKFAWIGFDWRGCKSKEYPRPLQWDEDFGEPLGRCSETSPGVFERRWTHATATWDCGAAAGHVARAPSAGYYV